MSTATRVTGEMLATLANGQEKPAKVIRPPARFKLSRLLAYTLAMMMPGLVLVVVKWLGELAQSSLVEVSSFVGRR